MKKIGNEPTKQAIKAFAVFPGGRSAVTKVTNELGNCAAVGDVERGESVLAVLDGLYFAGGNDAAGVFLVAGGDEVRVYKTVRDGYKRVI